MKYKNSQSEHKTFSKNAQGFIKIYDEVLLLLKFFQTKPSIKKMNINFYDLYYTVNRIRDENKDKVNQYEDDDNGYIDITDFFST